ncbi:glycoside hydrolase family 5 protein [Marasmius fiardii PR-910]|nr:glycoside hydrolase family 5 protein [Marasmius fiardii PR-910]
MRFLTTLITFPALFVAFTGANNTGGKKSGFVSTNNGRFQVNGSNFKWIGTTAYWLSSLNTEQDIINTLSNMSHAGIKVVRTWAFNDVETVPTNGTWFQLIANGTTTVNTGPNGLQKLDLVMKHAERLGMYVVLSLTNNWNPREKLDGLAQLWDRDVTLGTNNSLPRNFLSNDYGGMDVYVRQFGLKNHDEFFTNQTLNDIFKNYTTQIVKRYKDSPAVFSWELANDPRCNSTLNASSTCETRNITRWHADVAEHVRSVDPNHLVSSGNQGFFCMDCPKLFDLPPPPPPETSPAPGSRRSLPPLLTREKLLQDRRERWKRTRAAAIKSGKLNAGGKQVRGQWRPTPTRRQVDPGVGSAFDGSHGVDSQDILAIPDIGFSSFQLFPDQNSYGVDDPNLSPFDNVVQNGVEWIKQHATAAQILGKPVALTGFGLVTQANAQNFVPFNSSTAPFATQGQSLIFVHLSTQEFGVTDQQRDDAYQTWLDTGIDSGLEGIIQYQWGQNGLTTQPGTTISPNVNSTTQSPNINQAGQSPNDGYSTVGVGQVSLQDVLSDAAQEIGNALA